MAGLSNSETRRAERDARPEALHERLTAAVEFAAGFRSRSFGNTLLILAQHADAFERGRVPEPFPTLVAGFRQRQQLSRSVLKGQSGYMIFAPVTARFPTSRPSVPESWRRLERGEKPRVGEVVRSKMVNAKPAYVWDASQTDGEPVPERPRPMLLEGEAPEGLWEGLAGMVAEHGFTLGAADDARALGGANGVTNFTERTVTVRADMDATARVKAMAHELAHITLGHEDRRREGLHRGIGKAESVAMMVTAAWGMDSTGYTVPYVGGWSASVKDRDPVEVVRETGELVRRTAVAILDRLPDPPLGDGSPPGLDRTHGTEPAPVHPRAPEVARIEHAIRAREPVRL